MQEHVRKSLADYAYAFVSLEFQRTLDEIRNGSLEVPETLRIRSVIRNTPLYPNITVNVPERVLETPVFLSPPSAPDSTSSSPKQEDESSELRSI
jgi:hypothetical protein